MDFWKSIFDVVSVNIHQVEEEKTKVIYEFSQADKMRKLELKNQIDLSISLFYKMYTEYTNKFSDFMLKYNLLNKFNNRTSSHAKEKEFRNTMGRIEEIKDNIVLIQTTISNTTGIDELSKIHAKIKETMDEVNTISTGAVNDMTTYTMRIKPSLVKGYNGLVKDYNNLYDELNKLIESIREYVKYFKTKTEDGEKIIQDISNFTRRDTSIVNVLDSIDDNTLLQRGTHLHTLFTELEGFYDSCTDRESKIFDINEFFDTIISKHSFEYEDVLTLLGILNNGSSSMRDSVIYLCSDLNNETFLSRSASNSNKYDVKGADIIFGDVKVTLNEKMPLFYAPLLKILHNFLRCDTHTFVADYMSDKEDSYGYDIENVHKMLFIRALVGDEELKSGVGELNELNIGNFVSKTVMFPVTLSTVISSEPESDVLYYFTHSPNKKQHKFKFDFKTKMDFITRLRAIIQNYNIQTEAMEKWSYGLNTVFIKLQNIGSEVNASMSAIEMLLISRQIRIIDKEGHHLSKNIKSLYGNDSIFFKDKEIYYKNKDTNLKVVLYRNDIDTVKIRLCQFSKDFYIIMFYLADYIIYGFVEHKIFKNLDSQRNKLYDINDTIAKLKNIDNHSTLDSIFAMAVLKDINHGLTSVNTLQDYSLVNDKKYTFDIDPLMIKEEDVNGTIKEVDIFNDDIKDYDLYKMQWGIFLYKYVSR
jgi:hypothetical protein